MIVESFNRFVPHIMVVDNFYKDPDSVRAEALKLEFIEDNRYYKGSRTQEKYVPSGLMEEFSRLMDHDIEDWDNQPMNAIFQKTTKNDPLVYHSDQQDYAGAIYLTPGAPADQGTSFWRHKGTGCRRPPQHFLERKANVTSQDVYNDNTLLNPDAWDLIDQVGSLYNRLVIWDAKMIHSATRYGYDERLVQLFFFNLSRNKPVAKVIINNQKEETFKPKVATLTIAKSSANIVR
jgi:hypothetical protein